MKCKIAHPFGPFHLRIVHDTVVDFIRVQSIRIVVEEEIGLSRFHFVLDFCK